MRRLIFLMVLSCIITSSVCAQQPAGTFSVAPKVGMAISNFSGKMPVYVGYAISQYEAQTGLNFNDASEWKNIQGVAAFNDTKNKLGVTFGVEAQYQFTSVFGLSLGAFYAHQGATYKTKGFDVTDSENVRLIINDDIKVKLHCINVPLLANVYVWKGLSLKAGIQPEFIVGKKMDVDCSLVYNGQTTSTNSHRDAGVKSFALSIPVGIGYEYKNFVADLRYCLGVTDVNDNAKDRFSGTAHNMALSFTLGYKLLW